MSAALINRSLTTVRTELEFLRDSEVITEALYDRLIASIPTKYDKNASSWDVDRLSVGSSGDKLADDLSRVSINSSVESKEQTVVPKKSEPAPVSADSAPRPAPKVDPKPLGYCRSLYDYNAQEAGDLELKKDDKVAVLEHLSEDWWKGYRSGTSPADAGVFPSNYVTVISQQEFELQRGSAPVPLPDSKDTLNDKTTYNDQYAPPQYSPNQYAPPMNQQPSYGGYSQYPPPLTNYYPPPQQQMVPMGQPAPQPVAQPMAAQDPQLYQQQSGGSHPHLKKFGSKFGNAAIFGAGATVGSNIVNSIF